MEEGQSLNDDAARYLTDYCEPENVRDFAVMLIGPWGSGKTYFVKKFLQSKPKHLYVSLYGMTEVKQIDDEFYRQLHPVLASKGMRILGSVAKAVAKGTLKLDFNNDGKDDGSLSFSLPDVDVKAGLTDPRERLLVFDDLERAAMPVSVALGYINAFVEHDGLKAIIIANESEILKNPDQRYSEIKEKLIGRTLRIRATVESAYASFLENIHDEGSRSFLETHRERVIGIHKQSGTDNLRILKQAMWDYERVARLFDEIHWKNERAMLGLMSALLCFSIEHRAGHILDRGSFNALLGDRFVRAFRRHSGEPKTIEDEIDERYPQVDFGEGVLDAEILADVVLEGRANPQSIKQALGQSAFFAASSELPLWQRAWDMFNRNDDEAEEIVEEFVAAFNSRQFKERGEIAHAFGILLRYARLGLVGYDPSEALRECKAYVDDLTKAGMVPVEDLKNDLLSSHSSYGRHGFQESNTQEFREATSYLDAASDAVVASRFPENARALLDSLEAGHDDYVLDLCTNNVRTSRFRDLPVLATLPPNEFVDRVLGMQPAQQRQATEALQQRYQFGTLNGSLAAERPWLEAVRDLFRSAAECARPLSRERLQYMLTEHLDAVLDPT